LGPPSFTDGKLNVSSGSVKRAVLSSGRLTSGASDVKMACRHLAKLMSRDQVVQVLASASGQYRAEIVCRRDGLFQVHLERWTEEIVPDHGKVAEFWEEVRTAVSITDELSRAIEIAAELLRNHVSR
jgi:hypothetical protein